ncbi:arginase family protein [Chromobacterium paludis]|uniref:Arginase family protein n=1 Tax=Chromobacterium paludis TaxID=2605945 RepID=A0A5C1DKG7_9NEIS|nr:arginase family protein [Chromobacterium paludis]QEL57246.1 arginase family protein [Chromobacterium paludis]
MVLHLSFAQWQGSGDGRRIADGGHLLKAELDAPLEIAIEACPSCVREDGVDHLPALRRQLYACAETIAAVAPQRILLCGGDCACEIAPLAYLNQLYGGRLNVVWLDAHADLNTPHSSPSGHLHGMPLRLLLGEGHADLLRIVPVPLRPEQVHLAGVREVDPPEATYIESNRITWHKTAALQTRPECLAEGLNPAWPTYLHLDLDVLDPAEFPHVCCPTPDGLSRDVLLRAMRAVAARTPLLGAGLTECTAQRRGEADAAIELLAWLKQALAH